MAAFLEFRNDIFFIVKCKIYATVAFLYESHFYVVYDLNNI